ncbi:MAG: c-type cytochrome [Magnetospirillum sp.]|nr:c-type cytochrome [Magnetospirillum sp.]
MRIAVLAAVAAIALSPLAANAADDKAAEALAKDSNCFKCHSVSKKKEGPSYKEVAEKYKGNPEAQAKLFAHVTTQPTVKIDGKEEKHEKVKSDNPAEINNLIEWILSR